MLVGVAADSFLIYLSPLSPAEKLLSMVVAVFVAADKLRVKTCYEKEGGFVGRGISRSCCCLGTCLGIGAQVK